MTRPNFYWAPSTPTYHGSESKKIKNKKINPAADSTTMQEVQGLVAPTVVVELV